MSLLSYDVQVVRIDLALHHMCQHELTLRDLSIRYDFSLGPNIVVPQLAIAVADGKDPIRKMCYSCVEDRNRQL